ncbi:hypothetical protein I0D00_07075 [Pseudomonas lalucatii]|uniref:Uncharacterized protein n=1 Tax=Pseudomonas lalucatii TaxID=1424203 RepID=A0ABS5PZP7_9PSED|nr:hypothetical protein [Pseudomonas lalucatii]
MLRDIINSALTENDFELIHQSDFTSYYVSEQGDAVRFSILHQMTSLPTPEELNSEVTQNAPSSFIEHPAFKKNCDLICIFKLETLSGFKDIEDSIFSIEEDPYHYKKYVLYYSDSEEQLLSNASYKDIIDTISDKKQFDDYKDKPLAPSMYSIAAKVFIKLPFLKLPFKKRELVPLKQQALEVVSESGLNHYYDLIQKNSDIQKTITDLINHELENIPD